MCILLEKGFLLGAVRMYGTIYTIEHVNSSPIGMGNLCSTLLQSLAIHCLCVDGRAVCGVFCPQEAVIESASVPTGEFSLVSVRKLLWS